MRENAFVALGLFGFGVWVLWSGLRLHLGHWRQWFLMEDTMFAARPVLYGLVPFGLAVICFAIDLLLPTLEARRTVAAYIVLPLIVLAVILSFWQPKWLKPKWVRWLEENNQDILELIVEEGRKTKEWGKVVATQEGLEAWVAEVRQEHNRPVPIIASGVPRSAVVPTLRPEHSTRVWAGWPVGLVILAVSSGLGQLFLGSGLIGFIGGSVLVGLIYLLRSKEKKGL
jgi:hypothetical protein